MLQFLRKFHGTPSFLVIFFCDSRGQTQNLVRATQSSASEPHASFPLSYSSYLSFLVLYFLWCVDESHSSLGFIIYIYISQSGLKFMVILLPASRELRFQACATMPVRPKTLGLCPALGGNFLLFSCSTLPGTDGCPGL